MPAFLTRIFGLTWRALVVALAYIAGTIGSGMLLGVLGLIRPTAGGSSVSLAGFLLAGLVIGFTLGPIAQGLAVSRWRHLLIWSCVLFFNLASVMVEGAFFAPALVPMPIPVLALQQLLAVLVTALAVTLLFAPRNQVTRTEDPPSATPRRGWASWAGRFAISALSYLVFYLVFGGLNYNLVTGPYYATHAGGLQVPPALTVWLVEAARAPLIVLSVLFFLLALRASRRRAMVLTGLLLFLIGGVAPLMFQLGALPTVLLVASGVEIFFQNFLLGVVTAWLLGQPAPAKGGVP